MRAEITDKAQVAGLWMYAWQQVETNFTTGLDQTPLNFAQGTTTVNPAVELNNNEIDRGTIVDLKQRGYVGGQMWFEFEHTPAGGGSALASAEAVLPTDYTIVSISTWEDTGLTLTLPTAGTYFLFGQVTAWMYASAVVAGSPPNTGWLSARLYDATNSAAVPRSAAVVCSLSSVAQQFGTAAFSTVVTVTGSTTISLQGFADPGGGITFSTREIMNLVAGTEGSTHIGYLQIG